ncbi:MAG: polysaccharide biosynthesis protein [Luteitalea sp.]|nr:polysaccharide biosynthesis protein [Luteitalea sp.]
MRIPMSSPDITEAEVDAVLDVLRGTHLSIGPRIREFEEAVAALVGVREAVGVASGTVGLHLGILAAGVRDDDIVITSPFSFVASANVALYERAIPVFVDVDQRTGNVDPSLVAQAVSDLQHGGSAADRWLPPCLQRNARPRGRVRALLPVHVFGQPCDMDPLLETAQTFDLYVIEDACEAIGAEYKGRKAGGLGDAGVFAFYPNKQMTTGEGGMIVTRRDEWSALLASLRNQGRDIFDGWLTHSRLGFNYRLDEMSAALGVAQLRRLDELLEKRARVAGWYNDALSDESLLQLPVLASTTTRMSWFVYVVRVASPGDRDRLILQLERQGIPARPYFSPIHLQPFYRERFGYQDGQYPVTEDLGRRSLALPFSSVMTESQVDEVCRAVRRALRETVQTETLVAPQR